MVSATQSERRIIAILVCAVVITASCTNEQPDEVGVSGEAARAIISLSPEDARKAFTVSGITGTWTPSDTQVVGIERSLRTYLQNGAQSASGGNRAVFERLLKEMDVYKRQFYGIMVGSNKCIRCVFAVGAGNGRQWKAEPLDIHDGKGFEFSYDLEDRSIHDFFFTAPP